MGLGHPVWVHILTRPNAKKRMDALPQTFCNALAGDIYRSNLSLWCGYHEDAYGCSIRCHITFAIDAS